MGHKVKRRDLLSGLGFSGLGLAAGGALAPFARPSRAFGQTGFLAKRVVIVSIAGGLRKRESLGMAEGATMPNLLGTVPLTAGFGDLAGPVRLAPEYPAPRLVVPKVRRRPLFAEGALVENLRYDGGRAGHLQAAACLACGTYTSIDNRADAVLPAPTLFEIVRRARNSAATDTWYLSNVAGFYKALRSSRNAEFGPRYAASWMSPASTFDPMFAAVAGGSKVLPRGSSRPLVPNDPQETLAAQRLTAVIDAASPAFDVKGDVLTTGEATARVAEYIATQFSDPTFSPIDGSRIGIGLDDPIRGFLPTRDALTIDHAERILEHFRPSAMLISLIDVDTCHNDFNLYLTHQRVVDALVAHLWDFIQSTAGLRDETALFILPEHGRHLTFNGKNEDSFGRSGLDHGGGDDGDREVWALALGPDFRPGVYSTSGIVQPGRSVDRYETIDVVHTALELLGHGDLGTQVLTDLGERPGLTMEAILR